MKKTALKIISILGAIFCAVFSLFSIAPGITVQAEDKIPVDYTNTKIMDDLADVNTLAYPKNPLGVPQVIRVQEYCFSEKDWNAMYYGLFIYIYNPTEVPIKTDRNFNKVNIATAYDDDGYPTSYSNLRLTYCDSVSNRLYKFYVADSETLLKVQTAYAKAHGGVRRYDIAGIELHHTDNEITNSQEKDRAYGCTWYFEGYAANCNINNPDAGSTLRSYKEDLETLKIEVKQTNWRTGAYENFVCDELNTVYFSVPEETFDKYGTLQKIKSEWYEYKTRPIFVTSDKNANAGFSPFIGKNIGEKSGELEWSVLWEQSSNSSSSSINVFFNKVYNKQSLKDAFGVNYTYDTTCSVVPQMDWFFYRENAVSNADFKVTKEEMLEYALWYSDNVAKASDKIIGAYGEYSVNLFEESIDADRVSLLKLKNEGATAGYVVQEIDAKDTGSLIVNRHESLWDKWFGPDERESYDPIIVLDAKENFASLDANGFAAKYLVNDIDAQNILDYCKQTIENGEKVVLFRFAVTDYYASTAMFEKIGNSSMSDEDGYVAQETVFLNFDVISLTFRGEKGADVVIPVVADPIDIINGLDAPPGLNNEMDKWSMIVGLILGAIVLIVLLVIIGVYFPGFGQLLLNGASIALKATGTILGWLCDNLIVKPAKAFARAWNNLFGSGGDKK